MATTYLQLSQQIKTLQAQAEQVKKKEMAGVIASIKEAIAVYALTAEELGFSGKLSAKLATAGKMPMVKPGRGKRASAKRASVAYCDDAGNTWGGRGPRPAWLRAALQEGAELSSFAAGGPAPVEPISAAQTEDAPTPDVDAKKGRVGKPAKVAKSFGSVKYRDDAGHTWSGLGPKPGWFKDALAAGKSQDELLAH